MLSGVTLMGLVAPGEKVTIGGPTGPVTIEGEPAAPLAVFRMENWPPNGETPEALQAEVQGHRVLDLMTAVGNAAADDRLDAEDVAHLVVALKLPGGRVVEVLVPVTEEILQALEDDGRIDAQEAMSIAGTVISGVLTLRS